MATPEPDYSVPDIQALGLLVLHHVACGELAEARALSDESLKRAELLFLRDDVPRGGDQPSEPMRATVLCGSIALSRYVSGCPFYFPRLPCVGAKRCSSSILRLINRYLSDYSLSPRSESSTRPIAEPHAEIDTQVELREFSPIPALGPLFASVSAFSPYPFLCLGLTKLVTRPWTQY